MILVLWDGSSFCMDVVVLLFWVKCRKNFHLEDGIMKYKVSSIKHDAEKGYVLRTVEEMKENSEIAVQTIPIDFTARGTHGPYLYPTRTCTAGV
jgi:hypothetical protein